MKWAWVALNFEKEHSGKNIRLVCRFQIDFRFFSFIQNSPTSVVTSEDCFVELQFQKSCKSCPENNCIYVMLIKIIKQHGILKWLKCIQNHNSIFWARETVCCISTCVSLISVHKTQLYGFRLIFLWIWVFLYCKTMLKTIFHFQHKYQEDHRYIFTKFNCFSSFYEI